MKRAGVVSIVLATCFAATMFFCAGTGRAAELVPFFTPPAGGGAYMLGAGIVSVSNKYIADPKLVQEASTGTMDIVRRMMTREAQKKEAFGIFGTVDAWNAYKGNNEYKGRPFANVRMTLNLSGIDLYLVVPANSPIKSYADVKGKRIGMGGPGSTVANTAQFLLDQHGVTKKDFKPYYYSYKESVEGIQNGSLDGGFLAGGYPIAAYNELATQKSVRIVPLDEGLVQKILKENAYYRKNVVKAKSYPGLEQDTTILGWLQGVFANGIVSSDIVYKQLKNLFDHKEDFYAIHPFAKEVTLPNAVNGVCVPLHPGAEKYYREVGLLKK